MKTPDQGWQWFLRIVERASISAAARDLNQSPAALSMALKRLEIELGARLFLRTTRTLTLTAEGAIWYQAAQTAENALSTGRDALAGTRGKLSGPLHVASATDFGRQYVLDWVERFCTEHPAVIPTLSLSDRVDNVIAEGIDITLRFGVPQESSAIAVPLSMRAPRVLVASPDFWKAHGRPSHPQDLARYPCLVFSVRDTPYINWRFSQTDHTETVTVIPVRISNQSAIVSEWARRGLGVMYRSILDIAPDLVAGRLQTALDDWTGEIVPLYLFRSGGHRQNPRVQAFIAHARKEMKELLRGLKTQIGNDYG